MAQVKCLARGAPVLSCERSRTKKLTTFPIPILLPLPHSLRVFLSPSYRPYRVPRRGHPPAPRGSNPGEDSEREQIEISGRVQQIEKLCRCVYATCFWRRCETIGSPDKMLRTIQNDNAITAYIYVRILHRPTKRWSRAKFDDRCAHA